MNLLFHKFLIDWKFKCELDSNEHEESWNLTPAKVSPRGDLECALSAVKCKLSLDIYNVLHWAIVVIKLLSHRI